MNKTRLLFTQSAPKKKEAAMSELYEQKDRSPHQPHRPESELIAHTDLRFAQLKSSANQKSKIRTRSQGPQPELSRQKDAHNSELSEQNTYCLTDPRGQDQSSPNKMTAFRTNSRSQNGVCGEFGWLRFLVVCFLYKANLSLRKSIGCGKKRPNRHF